MPLFSDREENPTESGHSSATQSVVPPEPKISSSVKAGGLRSESWLAMILVACGAGLLALATLASPRVPDEWDTSAIADASWSAVLQHAHEHRLQFGTDIIFTYGPLGFLATPYASTSSVARLMIDFCLSFLSALGLCLVAGRLGAFRRIALIAVYLFLLGNIYPRTDLLIELNLVCWALLCVVGSGRALTFYIVVLACVAAFASLVKISLFVMGCLTLVAISSCFILRREKLLSITLPALALVGFVAGWMGMNQNLLHLGAFLRNALLTAQGYNSAMGYEGSPMLRGRGILTGLLALGAIFAAANPRNDQSFPKQLPSSGDENNPAANDKTSPLTWSHRVLLCCWIAAMLFLVWKHGFVRTDLYHAGFFFGFAPIVALSFGLLSPACGQEPQKAVRGLGMIALLIRQIPWLKSLRVWDAVFTFGCCLLSVFTVQTMILPGDWKMSLGQPFDSMSVNSFRLIKPAEYRENLGQALEAERKRYRLPQLSQIIGSSTVDLFGCEQRALLANHLNYQPRPVFQTYAAYSAPLMRKNESFYQSSSRPEFVLFHQMAMDRKFPSMEDALVLKHLLINYEPVAAEGSFLLLKSARSETPSVKLLREGGFHVGETLDLTEFGPANLWLEMDLEASLIGRLRQFFYQPPKSRLLVWSGTPAGQPARRFRAPRLMLAAGFLVSPLELNTEDVVQLYQGGEVKRPTAIGVEFNPGDEMLWRKMVRFRIYQINNKLGAVTSRDS